MKNLRIGSKGSDVEKLQEQLSKHGYPTKVDGDFGPRTKESVVQFQVGRDLTPDGIVGTSTWRELAVRTKTRKEEIEADPGLSGEMQWALDQIPLGTPVERRAVLEMAIRDLGADESPDGSNSGPEIDHLVQGYNEYWGINDSTNYPWCAMAVSTWIGRGLKLGLSSTDMRWKDHPFRNFYGGSMQIADWGKSKGAYRSANESAPAGSAFVMARGNSGSDPSRSARAGHIGLVICDQGDGHIITIEGNVSNGVRCRRRKKSSLIGYITWWKS